MTMEKTFPCQPRTTFYISSPSSGKLFLPLFLPGTLHDAKIFTNYMLLPLIYIHNWIACGVCSVIVGFAFNVPPSLFNVRMLSAIKLFPSTTRACYVTYQLPVESTTNGNAMKQCACACVMAECRCSVHADVE